MSRPSGSELHTPRPGTSSSGASARTTCAVADSPCGRAPDEPHCEPTSNADRAWRDEPERRNARAERGDTVPTPPSRTPRSERRSPGGRRDDHAAATNHPPRPVARTGTRSIRAGRTRRLHLHPRAAHPASSGSTRLSRETPEHPCPGHASVPEIAVPQHPRPDRAAVPPDRGDRHPQLPRRTSPEPVPTFAMPSPKENAYAHATEHQTADDRRRKPSQTRTASDTHVRTRPLESAIAPGPASDDRRRRRSPRRPSARGTPRTSRIRHGTRRRHRPRNGPDPFAPPPRGRDHRFSPRPAARVDARRDPAGRLRRPAQGE